MTKLTKCIVCDKLRIARAGELFWQEMMNTRQEISKDEFLSHVDPSGILDEGETWDEYYNTAAASDEIRFYKSKNGTYFFQTMGFEFIWRTH